MTLPSGAGDTPPDSGDPACRRCGDFYCLRALQPTPYCDACAHDLVDELESSLVALTARAAELEGDAKRWRAVRDVLTVQGFMSYVRRGPRWYLDGEVCDGPAPATVDEAADRLAASPSDGGGDPLTDKEVAELDAIFPPPSAVTPLVRDPGEDQ